YVGTSARTMRTAMKESVPVEFELARAKNMLDEIIPELQANVRLIAQEEVEVADLGHEIQQAQGSLADERTRVTKIRNVLNTSSWITPSSPRRRSCSAISVSGSMWPSACSRTRRGSRSRSRSTS